MSLSQVTGACHASTGQPGTAAAAPGRSGRGAASWRAGLCIWARARADPGACPRCGQASAPGAQHVRAAPGGCAAIGGRRVVIRLTVRRFFCAEPGLPAVTFAEQVGGLTSRRCPADPAAGADAGRRSRWRWPGGPGRGWPRLLGLPASRSGLLRLVMALPDPGAGPGAGARGGPIRGSPATRP